MNVLVVVVEGQGALLFGWKLECDYTERPAADSGSFRMVRMVRMVRVVRVVRTASWLS